MSNCLPPEIESKPKKFKSFLYNGRFIGNIPLINWDIRKMHITSDRIFYDDLNEEEAKKIIKEMNDYDPKRLYK